jgi:hypothetical protein
MAHEITVSWDASPTPGATYNLYRGTTPHGEAVAPYVSGVTAPPSSPVTSVAASVGGFATYQGTMFNGALDALTGMKVTVAGFVHAANNGTFLCESSTATEVVLANPAAVAETASAAQKPRPYFTDTAVLPGQSYSYQITAVVAGVESVDSVEVVSPPVPFAPGPPAADLTGVFAFQVLAGSTITNTGVTTVTGDIGVSPGTSVTGFGPPAVVEGTIHLNDFVAQRAQAALLTAYTDAQARTGAVTIPADIGGMTFGPGVYNVASSLAITGTVMLDAKGDPDAVWVFQIGSTLTTAVNNSAVILANGAQLQNVFWAVGSSATLNGGTSFRGTIMAQASITVNAGVDMDGRLLAISGAVTLDNDTIEMYFTGHLSVYVPGGPVTLGMVFFDCATGTYQQAIVAGVEGASRPTFSPTIGATSTDGGVTWRTIDPAITLIISSLPFPTPPNTPPTPPAPPQNPAISSED